MATIRRPVVIEYKLDTSKTFVTTRHYNLIKGSTLFSKKLNISKDRNCAKSSPDYWLKVMQGNKWSNWITGLFQTSFDGWYFGDTKQKRNLVIFHLEGKRLRLFYFSNFYTTKIEELINLIRCNY